MHTISVRRQSHSSDVIVQARWCSSYLCRLRGLTFRRSLPEGQGLLLVNPQQGRVSASIHMWMVFFPLGVIWLDDQRNVVDKVKALPWGIYFPSQPARYILEASPGILDKVEIGDELVWNDDLHA